MGRGKKRTVTNVEEENLDRFAGSSDEEEEDEELMAPPAPTATKLDEHHDADEENDTDDEEEDEDKDDESPPRDEYVQNEDTNGKALVSAGKDDDDDDSSSIEGEEMDAATKMANAMSRILGTNPAYSDKKSAPSSVVLAKTVTPLQKLQQKEKAEEKAMKEKRQSNRERNLTALHIPLSIATTNTIEVGGQLSVAKELEQERFHRRVATRGVVALFNAITQHQKTNNTDNDSNVSSKRKETSKLTKHGFLDKIKAAAKSKGGDDEKNETETPKSGKNVVENEGKKSPSWGALKDDFMLNPKKNWDEESSDEEGSDASESDVKADSKGATSRKKRRFSGKGRQ